MTVVENHAEFMPGGEHFGCRVMSLTPNGPWQCVGMHCAFCGKPSGSQGHYSCWEKNREQGGG
ncbi:hypothetical protein CROSSROADS_100 [Mycobacterium phage Crossroads]|uniref:hypothetical protein n=1 Tax=Mycobacterium phage Crossroads TaxID=1340836 RepID=UPI000387DFDB|nr:hypothetical protein N848_gp100 [Mycobacterium phage Crossroads]AGT13098.1 hypothetical protein CROSSROADS_100 [Mycobacterium phage Crossroads]